MDRGVWLATAHRVAKSLTQLSMCNQAPTEKVEQGPVWLKFRPLQEALGWMELLFLRKTPHGCFQE